MIRINKRVFLEHASNNALLKIKTLVRVSMGFADQFITAMIRVLRIDICCVRDCAQCKSYLEENDARQVIADSRVWDSFKKRVLQDHQRQLASTAASLHP